MIKIFEKRLLDLIYVVIIIAVICGVGKIGATYGFGWQVLVAAGAAYIFENIVRGICVIAEEELVNDEEDNETNL